MNWCSIWYCFSLTVFGLNDISEMVYLEMSMPYVILWKTGTCLNVGRCYGENLFCIRNQQRLRLSRQDHKGIPGFIFNRKTHNDVDMAETFSIAFFDTKPTNCLVTHKVSRNWYTTLRNNSKFSIFNSRRSPWPSVTSYGGSHYIAVSFYRNTTRYT